MTRYAPLIALALVAALAGCGVDGPPTRPDTDQPAPGLDISGEARIGVVSTL
ncbi:hypothetical protein SAMN04487972_11518 [Paracoccus halophilus]|uniref:Argininosuccinate lyase n=1 Tax=Paracoccus halophilus TaxID=376733 RepID=A0A1I0TXP7_9RHOB|nr:lipoprotein [Paracoccus halophilus]SFA56393.1 hypothetical protein SAMN04487972_11518 [Paracoccus halophilus]